MNYGFREAYFEYFESCNFSRENTNIDVSVFMVDLRMINMSSECEYDWYWKISACSTEYEVCDSFASLTRQQTSYSSSAGWYFRYHSIHIQITYTYRSLWKIMHAMQLYNIFFISNIVQVCTNYQIRMQCSSFTWILQTFLYSAQFTTQATSHKYI
jgi:hypothetical protein